jgi:hypothetical protein
MILRGSAGRICHLENVKSYISYLQQYTNIIKMFTLKTYFSYIESCDFSRENTNIDVSVFMFDLRMISMSSECEYD